MVGVSLYFVKNRDGQIVRCGRRTKPVFARAFRVQERWAGPALAPFLDCRGKAVVALPLFRKDFRLFPSQATWGCSAVGSAREWHSRGRRFNPGQLHQTNLRLNRAL